MYKRQAIPEGKRSSYYVLPESKDIIEYLPEQTGKRGAKPINKQVTFYLMDELMEQFRNNQAQEGNTGKPEITVVNIQRFAEDRSTVDLPAYATNLQRVFIIDEAHRGYKPEGSFLANLLDADKNAIKIALTGTPLLKDVYKRQVTSRMTIRDIYRPCRISGQNFCSRTNRKQMCIRDRTKAEYACVRRRRCR